MPVRTHIDRVLRGGFATLQSPLRQHDPLRVAICERFPPGRERAR